MKSVLSLSVSNRFYTLVSEANDYYNANAGYSIADQFMSAVQIGLNRIEENPYCGARYTPPPGFKILKKLHYRTLNLASFSSFPYIIYYEIEAKRIVVHVIYHHSRNRDSLLHS